MATTGIQFAVAEVERVNADTSEKYEFSYHKGQKLQGAGDFELKCFSDVNRGIKHGFLATALHAWSNHIEFSIKPDHIWQMVIQGFASIVTANSEHMRKFFVDFEEGKEVIEVERDDFIFNSPNNDWVGCVAEFEKKMNERLQETTKSKLTAHFSTTSPGEIVASKIAALSVCETYFDHVLSTLCGFPSIELQGTIDDWISLKDKTQQLLGLDPLFSKWQECLIPVLDRFLDVFRGNVDKIFWDSMIKRNSEKRSGAPKYYNGWFHVFIPYLKCNELNPHMVPYSETNDYTSENSGIRSTHFPCGVSKVPVLWKYNQTEIPIYFVSGFMGHAINKDKNNISPVISWFVQDKDKYDEWFKLNHGKKQETRIETEKRENEEKERKEGYSKFLFKYYGQNQPKNFKDLKKLV